jgi:hypothetical protein
MTRAAGSSRLAADAEVSGRLGHCAEVVLVDARVADRLILHARLVADHVCQQDYLVVGHPLNVQRLRYPARNRQSVTGFQILEPPPSIQRHERAAGARLQFAARCHP